MNHQILTDAWIATRRASVRMLPIAASLFFGLTLVVYLEELHRSDLGYLFGAMIGALGYWTLLEALSIVRISKLLRKACN